LSETNINKFFRKQKHKNQNMKKDTNYILVTAARNEEKFIEKTLKAIIEQTILPKEWVIVNDNSSDNTEEIIKRYALKNKFIKLITRKNSESRNFGSQVRSIRFGLEHLGIKDYKFIGNIDADISFESKYFEKLIQKFYELPLLGLAGGYIHEVDKNGIFIKRKFNLSISVPHAVQLFRRECFEKIGGYLEMPFGGPDTVAEICARMKGWDVRSFEDLNVYHHRKTATANGRIESLFRQGRMDKTLGYYFWFEIIRLMRRAEEKPIILSVLIRFAGFLFSAIANDKSPVPLDVINYSKREQIKRFRISKMQN
jgi:poly-beta-1,6-N-acetyl-D-glucosamine synthase